MSETAGEDLEPRGDGCCCRCGTECGGECFRVAHRQLVERSSLGDPAARALRASVSDEQAQRIVRRARELEAEEAK